MMFTPVLVVMGVVVWCLVAWCLVVWYIVRVAALPVVGCWMRDTSYLTAQNQSTDDE
jgi:hypothetical protein